MGVCVLKHLFLLDPSVTFFNHGSFGACPRPIFEEYQRWQLELERQPVEFMARRFPELMQTSRTALAEFIGCAADEVVYVPNATTAGNIVARSLEFEPGDEILTTDLEYGAMDRMWMSIAGESGATYRRVRMELPVTTAEAFIDRIWSEVKPSTRLIFLSHITSSTGLVLPIEQLITRALEAHIPVFIDGAHVPGQLDLDLAELGVDFYTGNCHKWLMTPKGSAFLYVRREWQHIIKPLVVSWGNSSVEDSPFIQENEYQGTSDPAAFLTVPAAIDFINGHDWPRLRRACRERAQEIRRLFAEVFGGSPLAPADSAWYAQLVAHEVTGPGGPLLQSELYQRHKVEIPVSEQNGKWYIRASVQVYNDDTDIQKLADALHDVWPSVNSVESNQGDR
jgi:isopenicillin-N epimerase